MLYEVITMRKPVDFDQLVITIMAAYDCRVAMESTEDAAAIG